MPFSLNTGGPLFPQYYGDFCLALGYEAANPRRIRISGLCQNSRFVWSQYDERSRRTEEHDSLKVIMNRNLTGIICSTQRRFRRWCLENPGLAGNYDAVSGRARMACIIRDYVEFLRRQPAQLIVLEPPFLEDELNCQIKVTPTVWQLDGRPIRNRLGPGRPPKAWRTREELCRVRDPATDTSILDAQAH
jgi:hypothetical protein